MFNKIFDSENGFWRGMSKVADIVALNLLFILCSIPVVTIGASASAFYTIMLKLAKNEESYIFKGFIQAFKENFKKSTIIWLIMFLVGAFALVDIYLVSNAGDTFPAAFRYIIYAISFVYFLMLSFVFALQAKFENSIIGTIKNSLLMGIAHFLPWGVLIVLVTYLPVLILLMRLDFVIYLIPLMLIIGFGLLGYINSIFFNKIFKRYIPEEECEELSELN